GHGRAGRWRQVGQQHRHLALSRHAQGFWTRTQAGGSTVLPVRGNLVGALVWLGMLGNKRYIPEDGTHSEQRQIKYSTLMQLNTFLNFTDRARTVFQGGCGRSRYRREETYRVS